MTKNKKDQSKRADEEIQEKNIISEDCNNVKSISDGEFACSDDDLRCRDISPEHCAELRNRKFTNEKGDIFLEVRALEERFQYAINEAKKRTQKEIDATKEKYAKSYRTSLENKEKQLQHEIAELKEEIEHNLNTLEVQERMFLSQIDIVYKLNKEKLAAQFIQILGLNF